MDKALHDLAHHLQDSFISYNSMSNFHVPAIPPAPLIPLSLCMGTACSGAPNLFIIILFIFGQAGSSQLHGLSLAVGTRCALWDCACGLLTVVASLAVGRAWAQQLRFLGSECRLELPGTGFVAPQHVRSSWTRINPVFPALASRFLFTTELPGKPSNARFTSDHLANSISLIRDALIYSVSKYLLSVFLSTMIDTGYYLFCNIIVGPLHKT